MEMIDKKIFEKLEEIEKYLPKFKDGRINYTKSKTCLVLTIFIEYNKKILLLKRSDKVGTYRNKWNAITGYIDEKKPLIEKIYEEIEEELGIAKKNILSYKIGKSFEFEDKKINKKWIVYPAKIKLKILPKIKLDWEHIAYKWINPNDLINYDIVPELDLSLKIGFNEF
jgi:8-oxo-dGTP pyrophosphatase MutT (NUDIX family)